MPHVTNCRARHVCAIFLCLCKVSPTEKLASHLETSPSALSARAAGLRISSFVQLGFASGRGQSNRSAGPAIRPRSERLRGILCAPTLRVRRPD